VGEPIWMVTFFLSFPSSFPARRTPFFFFFFLLTPSGFPMVPPLSDYMNNSSIFFFEGEVDDAPFSPRASKRRWPPGSFPSNFGDSRSAPIPPPLQKGKWDFFLFPFPRAGVAGGSFFFSAWSCTGEGSFHSFSGKAPDPSFFRTNIDFRG